MKRLLILAALLMSGVAFASTDPVADTRIIMAGTVTTPKVIREYLSGARDNTQPFKGALEAYKRVRAAEVPVPTPSPSPTPTPSPTPVVTLGGLPAIADNFDTAPALEVVPMPPESGEGVGAFRMSCFAGQLLRDDPIVFPGQPGASHLHQFWGNLGANAFSTYNTLRTTGDTTCGAPPNAPINRTAYWMPAMLDGPTTAPTTNVVRPDSIQTYYKQYAAGSADCKIFSPINSCIKTPNGIRMVFGYNMKTLSGGPADVNSADNSMMQFQCWADANATPRLNGKFHSLEELRVAGCGANGNADVIVIIFTIPPCWDGKNLDSPDNRSHMSFGTPETGMQVCPASHPHLIAAWQGNVRFTTDANFAAGKWRLASDDQMAHHLGIPIVAGSTLHFDYFEAWSPPAKDAWQKNCIDVHKSCSGGNLGNGTGIKVIGPNVGSRLVPLSSMP